MAKHPSKWILGAAIETAEGFYVAGVESSPRRIESDGEPLLGRIAAGSVNLSLSLELYLKSLFMGLEIKPPHGHRLDSLYNALPERVREVIRRGYESKQITPPEEHDFVLRRVLASTDPARNLERAEVQIDLNPDIDTLLETHCEAFVRWRYVHEIDEPLEIDYFYDFRSILSLLESVRAVARHLAEQTNGLITPTEPPAVEPAAASRP